MSAVHTPLHYWSYAEALEYSDRREANSPQGLVGVLASMVIDRVAWMDCSKQQHKRAPLPFL